MLLYAHWLLRCRYRVYDNVYVTCKYTNPCECNPHGLRDIGVHDIFLLQKLYAHTFVYFQNENNTMIVAMVCLSVFYNVYRTIRIVLFSKYTWIVKLSEWTSSLNRLRSTSWTWFFTIYNSNAQYTKYSLIYILVLDQCFQQTGFRLGWQNDGRKNDNVFSSAIWMPITLVKHALREISK